MVWRLTVPLIILPQSLTGSVHLLYHTWIHSVPTHYTHCHTTHKLSGTNTHSTPTQTETVPSLHKRACLISITSPRLSISGSMHFIFLALPSSPPPSSALSVRGPAWASRVRLLPSYWAVCGLQAGWRGDCSAESDSFAAAERSLSRRLHSVDSPS